MSRAARVAVLVALALASAGCGGAAHPAGTAPGPAARAASVGPSASAGPQDVRALTPATPSPPVPGDGGGRGVAGDAGDGAGARPGGRPPAAAAPVRDVSGPAPFVPAALVLPSGRRAGVDPADVADDGSLVVPADPERVGWWTGGARVGDPYGGVVLAGHVDSRRHGLGALAELLDVRPGQRLQVVAGDRAVVYEVTQVRDVPKARLAGSTDAFAQNVSPRLVLITCSGDFDPVARSYSDNRVVVAEPVGPAAG